MEACNIDLNYYSNHDVFSEQKFRVYSNIKISDCPSRAKFLKSWSVGWLETVKFFSWVFHFNSTIKFQSHRIIFSLHYNVAWKVFRYRCIEILHGRYFLSPLFYWDLVVCAQNHSTYHTNDKKKKILYFWNWNLDLWVVELCH